MNRKKEDYFCSAMRLAFIIIILLLIFFFGFSFIYYSNISLDSKISSFFGFTSTFGILATIFVYHMQKKSDDKKQKNRDEIIKRYIISDINENLKTVLDIKNFIGSEYYPHFNKVEIERCKDLGYMISAKDNHGDLIFINIIRVNNGNSIREAMKIRHLASDEVTKLAEEVDSLSSVFSDGIHKLATKVSRKSSLNESSKLYLINKFHDQCQEFCITIRKIEDKL